MSQDRERDALRAYTSSASKEQRAELAAALLSETAGTDHRYKALPAAVVWTSRILAIPVATWIAFSISVETGSSPFSRWSAFGGVAVAGLLAAMPNYFAGEIGMGYAGRPPRTRPLPPGLALFGGWLFLSLLAVFARLLTDAS